MLKKQQRRRYQSELACGFFFHQKHVCFFHRTLIGSLFACFFCAILTKEEISLTFLSVSRQLIILLAWVVRDIAYAATTATTEQQQQQHYYDDSVLSWFDLSEKHGFGVTCDISNECINNS